MLSPKLWFQMSFPAADGGRAHGQWTDLLWCSHARKAETSCLSLCYCKPVKVSLRIWCSRGRKWLYIGREGPKMGPMSLFCGEGKATPWRTRLHGGGRCSPRVGESHLFRSPGHRPWRMRLAVPQSRNRTILLHVSEAEGKGVPFSQRSSNASGSTAVLSEKTRILINVSVSLISIMPLPQSWATERCPSPYCIQPQCML